eukprot:gene1233-1557_t
MGISFEKCNCKCSKCLCNDLLNNFINHDSNENYTVEVNLDSCCSQPTSPSMLPSSSDPNCGESCSCSSGTCCTFTTLLLHQYFRIYCPNLNSDKVDTLKTSLLRISKVNTVNVDFANKIVEIETQGERSIFSILNSFKSLHLSIASIQSKECPQNSLMQIDDYENDYKASTAEVHNERIFKVEGMVCNIGCSNRIEAVLLENKQIQSVKINFNTKLLYLKGDVSDQTVIKTVTNLGFKCKRIEPDSPKVPLLKSDEVHFDDDNIHDKEPGVIEMDSVVPIDISTSSTRGVPTSSTTLEKVKVEEPPTKTSSISIGVYGMTCASCVAIVEHGIKAVDGVTECSVNLLAERAEVIYYPEVANVKDIIASLTTLGYDTKIIQTSKPGTIYLKITDYSKIEIAEKILKSISGVTTVSRSEHENELGVFVIECDALMVGPRTCIYQLRDNEIESNLHNPDADDAKESLLRKREILKWRRLFIFSIIFTVPIIIIAMILVPIKVHFLMVEVTDGLMVESILGFVLATPVQFVTGLSYYKASWAAIKNLHGNMDLLVSIGSTAAYVYSIISIILGMVNPDYEGMHFFETSASLITFITLGRWLENIAKGHTSSAIVKLMNLQSKESVLVNATIDESKNQFQVNSEEVIPSNLIQFGDILKVVPGSSVPTDGIVVFGSSSVDESMLTGESIPVTKKPGDSVTGGTLNLEGAIFMKANKVGSESTLSQIIGLVQQAQTSKAPIQAMADKISKVFVPGILIIGVLTFSIWIAAGETDKYPVEWRDGNSPFLFAFLTAIAVVVIACPCALGLATPTAVMVGTGVGAGMGILIKGGKALETAHKTSAILFDKTGTITTGKMTVTDYMVTPTTQESDFFNVVGSAESGSEHPIGRAIVHYCKTKVAGTNNTASAESLAAIQFPQAEDFVGVPGRGLTCKVNDDLVLIGNLSFMKENNIKVDPHYVTEAQQMETNGKTVIYVMYQNEFHGIMGISDIPREDSKYAIKKLKSLGLKVYMVTGDNQRAAKFIASEVGIPEENIFAEVIPKEKADKVRQLQEAGNVVCFVGDGINDSPALSQADVAVSVATGTDIAIESSSIVLLKNSLTDVYRSIHLSRVVFRRIRINFTLALLYNLLAVPLAAGLFLVIFDVSLPPMAAAAAMVVSSLSVLSSSLLLKLYRPPK